MKTIKMLEGTDRIDPDDYMRPLHIVPLSPISDEICIESFSQYGETPYNNIRWIKVRDYFGECHWGKTVDELQNEFSKMYYSDNNGMTFEFVRGNIPNSHVWHWKTDNKTW